MLIYHPAFDAYHCVFRMLAVAERVPETELDKARLLDFYLLFPALVASIRLPSTLRDARKLAKAEANVYHDPLNAATTFRELRHIQEAALKCIAASGLIDKTRFESGYVTRTDRAIPGELKQKIDAFIEQRQPVADIVLKGLADIPLRGHDGLKHRTDLMEYKYDVA
ncbi:MULTISPECIES: ABC-three component system middle component 5 [unclassified Caballeronia]|uniref:ABC-three component system middle component 5 n=1 Tax=unclassified Caballeronia TaxID=2646786 RepID=UPI0020293C98|nr:MULTISPECIES: ABC-three component system middle component 5 [unclassified Caballeronia]